MLGDTPKQRQLRSGSGASQITLNDIKSLIESVRSEIVNSFSEKFNCLNSTILTLQETISDLKKKNEELTSRYNNMECEMNILKEAVTSCGPSFIFKEMEERTRRSKNLVISGIVESTEESADGQEEEDRQMCSQILGALDIKDNCIDDVVRLGRFVEGRPRLLKVRCANVDFRDSVLQRAKRLREHSEYRRIYINPDLTRYQQTRRRQLLTEWKQRRDKGEEFVILGDRLLPRNQSKNFGRRF